MPRHEIGIQTDARRKNRATLVNNRPSRRVSINPRQFGTEFELFAISIHVAEAES
jgi:hypothetical protein